MLKKIVVGVGGASLLVCGGALAFGATQPTTWHVERSRVVEAAPEDVLPLLEDLEAWPKWAGGAEADDAAMTYTFGETRKGAGATYSWEGPGTFGSVTLTAVDAGGVAYEMVMEDSQTPAKGSLRLAPEGQGTKVTWTDEGDFGMAPVGGLMVPMMEQALGPHFEGGLERLDALAVGAARARMEAERVAAEAAAAAPPEGEAPATEGATAAADGAP